MKIYLYCILLTLSATILNAQKEDSSVHRTKLSILVLQYHESLNQIYWLDKKGEIDKDNSLHTSTSSIIAPIKYKGPKVITLCALKQKPNPDGSLYTPIAKASLPASKNTIIILIPNSKKKKDEKNWFPYRAVSIDDGDKKFTSGSRLVYNLTNSSIRGITGTVPMQPRDPKNNRFIIKPGKFTIVKSLSGKTFNQVYLEQYASTSKEWKRFKSSRWFHMPNKRKFVFIYQKGNTAPKLKIVSQNMLAPQLLESNRSIPEETSSN